MKSHTRKSFPLILLLLTAATGIFFRLWRLSSQILLDDEWHGLLFTAKHTFWECLTSFSVPGATSIPENLYTKTLLITLGWNETLLRLPSLVSGIIGVAVFPYWVYRRFGIITAFIFAILFSFSPFLVFYSRFARPYSMAVFMGFCACMLFFEWERTPKIRYFVLLLFTVFFSLYFHILVGVLPLCISFLVFYGKTENPPTANKMKNLLILYAGFWLAVFFSLGIPVLYYLGKQEGVVTKELLFSAQTLLGCIRIFTGISGGLLWAGILFFLGAGMILFCFRHTKAFFGMMLACLFYTMVFINFKPPDLHSPLVFSRYISCFFPLFYLFIAMAGEALRKWIYGRCHKRVAPLVFGVLLLVCLGPAVYGQGAKLIRTYVPPNNFSHHFAFHEPNTPMPENRSYTGYLPGKNKPGTNPSGISGFYRFLSQENTQTVILEYPMFIGDALNPLYMYQKIHKKRVYAGYTPGMETAFDRDFATASMTPGMILSMVNNQDKLHFSNLVKMEDIQEMHEKKIRYIVLHKTPYKEFAGIHLHESTVYPSIPNLQIRYQLVFGKPVFTDPDIIVFSLNTREDKR